MPGEKTVKGTLVTLKFSKGEHPKALRHVREVRYKPSQLIGMLKRLVDDETLMIATSIIFVDHTARPRIIKHRNLPTNVIEQLDIAFDEIERCPTCHALPHQLCDAGLHS